jgi:hypothetical protein
MDFGQYVRLLLFIDRRDSFSQEGGVVPIYRADFSGRVEWNRKNSIREAQETTVKRREAT